MWNSLSVAEKQPFELQHEAAVKDWEAQLEKWEVSPEYAQLQKAQQAEDTWRNLQIDLAQGLKRTADKDPKTPIKKRKSKRQLESVSESKSSGRHCKSEDGKKGVVPATKNESKKVCEEDTNGLTKQNCRIGFDVLRPQDGTTMPTLVAPGTVFASQVEESKSQVADTGLDASSKVLVQQIAHMEAASNTQSEESQEANAGAEDGEGIKQKTAKTRAKSVPKKRRQSIDVDESRRIHSETAVDMTETRDSNIEESKQPSKCAEGEEDANQQMTKMRAKDVPKEQTMSGDVDESCRIHTEIAVDMLEDGDAKNDDSKAAQAFAQAFAEDKGSVKQEPAGTQAQFVPKKRTKRPDVDAIRKPQIETTADMTETSSNQETADAGEDKEVAKQEPAKKRARTASKKPGKKGDAGVSRVASTNTTTDMEQPCKNDNNNEESEAMILEPAESSTASANTNPRRNTEINPETIVGIRPHGKQTRRQAGTKAATALDFPEDVLGEARKIGYEPLLRNLASRPEIISIGASTAAMLEALKSSGGLVNAAKHALLSN